MVRKTIVVGNGLGMALDPVAFSLSTAMEEVWSSDVTLTDEQKNLIGLCLPASNTTGQPTNEDDLDTLQRVLAACDFLSEFDDASGVHWLSPQGQSFPTAIRRFIHQVACQFHMTGRSLPPEFAIPLCHFVRTTKSHVATLNYDPLLYDCFLTERILTGYSGDLVDGLTNSGYRTQNMYRRDANRLGWYLHLHGSPLFYDGANGQVRKLRRPQLAGEVIDTTHLVLTHVRHKMPIIGASSILSDYWRFFGRALQESEEIVLLGYSGFDAHLNLAIARHSPELDIKVVEWVGSQPGGDRGDYWRDKFKKDVELVGLDNILDFTDW